MYKQHRDRAYFGNQCLLNLAKHPVVFTRMQDLILRTSDKILSSRWNGPQTLQVLLQYAVKMCIYLKSGSLIDALYPLKEKAHDCCNGTFDSDCQNFLELLFSSAPDLRQIFIVPKLQLFSDTSVKRNELVQSFIHFQVEILQVLLDSDKDPNVPEQVQLKLVFTELKFLLTFLGDTPLQGTQLEESNILTEVEAVANEAGDFLYAFLFTINPVDEALSVLLRTLDILKAKIREFCTTSSNLPRGISQKTALVSLFIVDSLMDDLNHLIEKNDDIIGDLKDRFTILHKELMLTRSLLKDIEVHWHSRRETKECVMQLSNLAYEAEYIINLFAVGEVPIWYLTIRLTDFIQKNQLISNALTNIREVVESPFVGSLKPKTNVLQNKNHENILPGVNEMVGFKKQLRNIFDQLVRGPKCRQIISILKASLKQKTNVLQNENHESILPGMNEMVGFKEQRRNIFDQLVKGPKCRQIISITGMPGLGKTTLAKKLYDHSSSLSHFDKRCWIYVSQTYKKRNILFDILRSISSWDQSTMNNMDDQDLALRVHKSLKGNRYLIVMDDIWNVSAWEDFKSYFPDDNIGSRILFTSREKDLALEASSDAIIHALPLLTEDECWCLLKQKVFKNDVCPPKLQDIGKEIARNCEGLPLTVTVIASVLAKKGQEKNSWQEVASSLSNYIFKGASKDILELSYEHLPIHLRPCFLYFGAFGNSKEVSVRKLQSLWIAEGFVLKEEHRTLEDIAEEYLADLINRSLVQISKRKSDGGVKACNLHDLIRDMCLRIAEKETFLKVINKVLEFSRDLQGIEFLLQLRYLAISNLSLLTVSLENLEYLLAEHGRVIPPFIMRMPKLKHLNIEQPIRFSEHCDISQINNLETLSSVFIATLKDEEILKCSPNLRKLKCVCKPLLLEDGTYRYPNLDFLTQLDSLKIVLRGDIKGERPVISFPVSLRKLTLSEIGLPWEEMSVIGRLPILEVLKLESKAFKGETWNTIEDQFLKLKFLKLDSVELEKWNTTSSEHFPELERLVLRKCHKLIEIPSEIGFIPTLQSIEAHSCGKTLRDSATQIKEEQLDYGNEQLKIIISGSDEIEQ